MKSIKRKIVGISGILIVGMLILMYQPWEMNVEKERPSIWLGSDGGSNGARTSHAPIRINSDSEYMALMVELGDTISNLEIDASGAGAGIYIGNVSMGVIIERCTITGASGNNGAFSWNAGIAVYNSPNAIIRNNTINNGDYGIYVENSNNAVISNNIVQNTNTCGIYVKNTGNLNLDHNKATNCNSGISITGSDNANIDNNEISNNNVVGLQIESSDNVNIENNTVKGNKDGIVVKSSNNNVITSNEITNNANYGIDINGGESNVISDNHVTGNKIGIHITNSNTNVVEENDSIDNTQYDIYSDTKTNTIKNNNAKKVYTPKTENKNSPGFEFLFVAVAVGIITIYIGFRNDKSRMFR